MGKLLELIEQLLALFRGTGDHAAKVEVEGISIDSVTATDVTIKDAGVEGHQLVVNEDGSINIVSGDSDVATEATLAKILLGAGSTDATAYESVTVAAASIGFTAGTYGAATHAFATCETAQIRFRIDGGAPTTTEGHILNPGDSVKLNSAADIAAFRAIRTGATSGVLKVTYSGVV